MVKQQLLLLFFIFYSLLLSAQIEITGIVKECEYGDPLIGASIYLERPIRGVATDIEGKFYLKIDKQFPVKLHCSYVGYIKKEIQVDSSGVYEFCLDEMVTSETTMFPLSTIIDAPIYIHLPAPFMKIRSKELQRDNDVAITPALNRVSGVYMHSGALNTNRITIRGIGNRSPFATSKIRAYLDDIPLTSGDGETTLEDVDLSLIEQVDVWKGPTASIYGAGLGGMIHLRTGDNFNSYYLSTNTTMGSYGLIRNATNLNFGNKKKNFNLNINYNRTHSDGYRENNTYDREGIALLGKWKANEKNETTLLFNYIDLKAFIPSSLNRDDYENEPRKAAFTWNSVKGFEDGTKTMLGLSHQTKFAKIGDYVFKNKTSLFGQFRNAYESRPFNILEEENRAFGLRTSFDLDLKKWERPLFPMLSIGVEAFNEQYEWQTFVTNGGVQGEALSDNREVRSYINIFGQFYKNITKNISLLAGVNLNSTGYDYKALFDADSIDLSGDYQFDLVASPQLGLSYQVKNNLAFFTTVSHGFSPPSLEETLTPDGAINPEIQPEQGWNFELGSRGRVWDKLTYELTFYSMNIRDLLVAKRVGPDQFVGVNAGKTQHNGMELYADYKFSVRRFHMTFFSTYTYSDYQFVDFEDGDLNYDGNELTGTAPHHFNIGLDINNLDGFYGHLNYNFVDAFPMRDDNSIESDAYQLLNLKVGYKRTLFEKIDLNAFFGIRNVLDEQYASMILINAGSFGGNAPRYYYPGLPRNYYGGIELKYRF